MSIDSTPLSASAQQIFEAAMKLPGEERVKLAERLYRGVDTVDPEWEEAWSAEIARRVADIESGKATLIPWEEVRDRLWKGIHVPPRDRAITHKTEMPY